MAAYETVRTIDGTKWSNPPSVTLYIQATGVDIEAVKLRLFSNNKNPQRARLSPEPLLTLRPNVQATPGVDLEAATPRWFIYNGGMDGDGMRGTVCFVAVRLGVSFAPNVQATPGVDLEAAKLRCYIRWDFDHAVAQTNADTLIKPPTECWDFTAPTACWDFTVGWTETG
ncbi:hypothetical protein LTR27_001132 [Elasticomyces elasticus]|nr:hypothetical protein LTR27_001132 [Elasticomyces elasticus]